MASTSAAAGARRRAHRPVATGRRAAAHPADLPGGGIPRTILFDEGAQPGEAVARDAAGGAELPERVLDLAAAVPRGAYQLVEEGRAHLPQSAEHRAGRLGEALLVRGFVAAIGQEPGEIAPPRQGDQRGPGRRHPALARREATPHHLAREAQLVEPGRLVPGDARGEHLGLPGARRQLEPLELLDGAEHAGAAPVLTRPADPARKRGSASDRRPSRARWRGAGRSP